MSLTGVVLASENSYGVKGSISFQGTVPMALPTLITADADVCGKVVVENKVQVDKATGGLQDVVVSLQGVPLPPRDDKVETERIIANTDCRFLSRVGVGRVGDSLAIHNRDPILHNTHIKLGKRTFVNVAQLAASRPIVKTLKRAGLHVVRCDKHTFMRGWLQVFDHPFAAVTDIKGAFQIPHVPPGTYTIVAWHQTLGRLEKKITVSQKGTATINFTYP